MKRSVLRHGWLAWFAWASLCLLPFTHALAMPTPVQISWCGQSSAPAAKDHALPATGHCPVCVASAGHIALPPATPALPAQPMQTSTLREIGSTGFFLAPTSTRLPPPCGPPV